MAKRERIFHRIAAAGALSLRRSARTSWSECTYGWNSESPDAPPPSRTVRHLQTLAGWGMLTLPFTGLVSLFWSDFIPSPMTIRATIALAIVVGLFYAAFFLGVGNFGWNPRHPRVAATMRSHRTLTRAYVRVPLMSLVFFGFAWLSFSSAVPWGLNAVVGSTGSMAVVVGGWEDESYSYRSGRSCARPTVQGVPFGMLGRRALCVQSVDQSAFPAGAPMILEGRVSVFGISAKRYRVLAPARPVPDGSSAL